MSHLPKSINVPRRQSLSTSVCTLSLSENTPHLNGLLEKEKRELAEELIWLRETFKAALQESWNEVECLQSQCAEHVETKSNLNVQLTDSRAEEEVWRLRCLAAEKIQVSGILAAEKIQVSDSLRRTRSVLSLEGIIEACPLEIDDNLQQPSGKKTLLKFCDKIRSWSSGNLLGMEEDAKSLDIPVTGRTHSCSNKHLSGTDEPWYMQDVTNNAHDDDYFIESVEQTAGETGKANRPNLRGNANSQEDLSLTISSRDQVIVSLEQTINQQLNHMQNLQAEMVCLMEAQRIKDKRLSSVRKREEERLDKLIESLRKKLKESETSAKEHNEELLQCKVYIQELTDELEKMLKIVKKAEEGGFLLDCSLSSQTAAQASP